MKRNNRLLQRVLHEDNLLLAFWKASKGKRYARQVLAYQSALDENLRRLGREIGLGCVGVGDYRHFMVYEPKARHICACAFREQVLHHALMNVCHDSFERVQIYDSYASRKGKGTYAALKRSMEYSRRYSWFMKLDVRKFFDSIHHDVLKAQLCRLFKEAGLLQMFYAIIDSYAHTPCRGVPIGNLTSQYFANHYLSGLDHFIKDNNSMPAYVRYMDDMVLWSDDKAQLKDMHAQITEYTGRQLRCELKPVLLNRTAAGLPFLGYRVFQHHLRLLQQSKQRFIKKAGYIHAKYHSGEWTESQCQRHILPLIAFTTHCDSLVLGKMYI